jgi:hypothetical protein
MRYALATVLGLAGGSAQVGWHGALPADAQIACKTARQASR